METVLLLLFVTYALVCASVVPAPKHAKRNAKISCE